MRIIIAVVSFVAFCLLGYIAYESKTTVSYAAVIGSCVAFLSAVANLKKSEKHQKAKMQQKIGDNSTGFQAGGDIHFNNKDDKK